VLLAIDVGNTNTVVGVFEDGPDRSGAGREEGEVVGLTHHWRIATVPERTADELALVLTELVALDGLVLPRRGREDVGEGPAVTGIAVSSTVPALAVGLREMAERYFDCPLVVVAPGTRTGIAIRFDNPREVGPDRIANAVAAVDLHGAPSIVVDLGTATTFDVVADDGAYVGGVIVPGLGVSMDALVQRAAALRRVELVAPAEVVGRSTVEAMQSGAIYGQASLVNGLCSRIEEEIGAATIIVTGGFGPVVFPYLGRPAHHEPWLTLHGLRLLFDRNIDRPDERGPMSEAR